MSFVFVALPLPVRRPFLYRVPEALRERARPGAPVEVPVRGRLARGVVIERAETTDLVDVREVKRVLGEPVLTPHLLALVRWVAEYYLAPLGEVVAAALPGGHAGFAGSRARKGAREDGIMGLAIPERVTLTAEQRSSLATIEDAIGARGFRAFLLHGVTASGKTEVYLRAARAVREQGGQSLVLVPEVALISQIVPQFKKRFGGRVGVLHSYLSVGERRRTWELARRGALDIVIGARSAVFAPLPNLRLVIVDEEHEPAYKQSEQLRYHGRDVAVRRAQMLDGVVVLGSATPALETLANASRGKYARLVLPKRIDKRPLPKVRIVDLRREGPAGDLISAPLRSALGECLARREQALVWLNRRGHSHYTQCRGCGWIPRCPSCDISLTLHLDPHHFRCHYCDHQEPATVRCRECQAPLLRFAGGGTQRAERELKRALPMARVLRLDTDVARERAAPAEVLARFGRGEADVLLGTQMIAKGLDFPRVTLVGVLDADVALHLPDFRAAERTWQLLVQVAGRAGRGHAPGEVLVQTCTPEHPAIASLATGETRTFFDGELADRREARYPPFTRLVTLLASGADEAAVERTADALAGAAAGEGVEVLGPAPQLHARLRGKHRWHVLLRGESAAVRAAAERALTWAESTKRPGGVRVIADVDPVEVA